MVLSPLSRFQKQNSSSSWEQPSNQHKESAQTLLINCQHQYKHAFALPKLLNIHLRGNSEHSGQEQSGPKCTAEKQFLFC